MTGAAAKLINAPWAGSAIRSRHRARRAGAWIAVVAASLGVSSTGSADAGDVGGQRTGQSQPLVEAMSSSAVDRVGSDRAGLDVVAPPQLSPEPPAGERLGGSAPTVQPGSHRYIVRVGTPTELDEVVQRLAGVGAHPTHRWHSSMLGVLVELDGAALREVMQAPGVLSIEPDRPLHQFDSQSSPPWGLDRIDQRTRPLDGAYNYVHSGLGVTAYVIDSGLWLSHDEFIGRVAEGAYWDFGDATGTWDCNGHGTHVSGTLGGSTYGVAKGVSIVPVKVLDCSGEGTMSSLIAGIDWVTERHVAGMPAVANLSLGGVASASVDAAVEALIADGVTVVVGAGNNAAPTCNYSPARVPAAVTVAASRSDDQRAAYSNYGSCNDILGFP